MVACRTCGAQAAIEAPMLLIRPGETPSLLLAMTTAQLAEESPASGEHLAREALAARARSDDIDGPVIPLPRLLLLLILARDVGADAADPNCACQEVRDSGVTEPLPSWYGAFLQLVRDGELQRRIVRTFKELPGVPPDDLPGFLEAHSELSSNEALRIVSDLAAQSVGVDVELGQVQLQIVESLAAKKPVRQVAAEYLDGIEQFGRRLNERLAELIAQALENPGSGGIAHVRAALAMATALGNSHLEAELSADLAHRLLTGLVPDNQATEEAIRLFEQALTLISDSDPRWPAWVGNLGVAYQTRINGDARENWETARDLLDRACIVSDRDTDPRRWSIIQTNYGLLLSERPGGATSEDLDLAIEHLLAGLEERSPQINVVDWAYSQLNLGLQYRRRGNENDLRDAADCYRQALAYLDPVENQQLWATLQNNLADVLLATDPIDAAGAMTAVQSGLKVANADTDPVTRARLLWTLGHAADRGLGQLTQAAVAPRQEALQLLAPTQAPELYLRIGGELVSTYGQLDDWHATADVYTTMLRAFATLYDAQASAEGRRRVLGNNPNLARWAAYAFARDGRLEQAVETIEAGRARDLSAAVGRDTADLARLAPVDPYIAARYQAVLSAFRLALAGADKPQTDVRQKVIAAERAMQEILDQIRAIPGFERFLLPMSINDICQAGGGTPIIYLINAPGGSYVLNVTPDGTSAPLIEAIAVPDVTSVNVLRLQMFDYIGDHAPGLLLAQAADPLRRETLLPAALSRLRELQPLVQPIADILARSADNHAIVIPTGLLGLIPLHAIPIPDSDRVLDDIGEIHFSPSAAVFAACRKRASKPRQQHLVGIADPETSLPPLPGSRAELAAIQEQFEPDIPATCTYGSEATRTWLLEHVGEATYLHLACHGASAPGTSADGRLYLADETILTIDDLIDGRLKQCRLAVASACQSGHYTANIPDEFTGLPAGFLEAGAACAIVSLWQVEDRATALLMVHLYELLLQSTAESGTIIGPVAALRHARSWLRQLTVRQIDRYIQAHPPLAENFRSLAGTELGCHDQDSEVRPYAAAQYWAAFTAWGT